MKSQTAAVMPKTEKKQRAGKETSLRAAQVHGCVGCDGCSDDTALCARNLCPPEQFRGAQEDEQGQDQEDRQRNFVRKQTKGEDKEQHMRRIGPCPILRLWAEDLFQMRELDPLAEEISLIPL